MAQNSVIIFRVKYNRIHNKVETSFNTDIQIVKFSFLTSVHHRKTLKQAITNIQILFCIHLVKCTYRRNACWANKDSFYGWHNHRPGQLHSISDSEVLAANCPPDRINSANVPPSARPRDIQSLWRYHSLIRGSNCLSGPTRACRWVLRELRIQVSRAKRNCWLFARSR